MSKKASKRAPGADRLQGKQELDRQTSYQTLLPAMGDGFHLGYHTLPGIVSDQNQKPHEWLENVARYMLTQGEEVGYSIPDVLAGEQQMKRLIRLPHEDAMRHQEMLDWRGTLALLLLWDSWEKDDTWPQLSFEDYLAPESLRDAMTFQRSVATALSPERAADGLRVFSLVSQREQVPDKRPLCLVSRSVVIMPAANPGDLSDVLPARIRWYNRARMHFEDPCASLDEEDRTRLVTQLRLLQRLNEEPSYHSALYAVDAPLISLLDRFIDDLLGFRGNWRERLEAGDPDAERELRTRALAVYGALGEERFAIASVRCEEQRLDVAELSANPLIQCLLTEPLPAEGVLSDTVHTLYTIDGVPFARSSGNYLLEPANHPAEAAALARVEKEVSLLRDYSGEWNRRTGQRLAELAGELEPRVGASRQVCALLRRWSGELLSFLMSSDQRIPLRYPIAGPADTLIGLMQDYLGIPCVQDVFSDCLLLLACPDVPPFEDAALSERCRVVGGDAPCYAVPPLSAQMAQWLLRQSAEGGETSAWLEVGSLSFTRVQTAQGDAIRAEFEVRRRKQTDEALVTHTVAFSREYQLVPDARATTVGTVLTLQSDALPYVVSWPNVHIAPELWRRYYVYAHRPESVDVWVYRDGAWQQGISRRVTELDETTHGELTRTWRTAVTETYPAYVLLKRGNLTLGALYNVASRMLIKHEPAAVVAVDFGSIATTVMLRQEERVQPAALPHSLHRALLRGALSDPGCLNDEFLPLDALLADDAGLKPKGRECTFYSVMDMFTDEEDGWRQVFLDGHIYFPESLAALMMKPGGTLYYDLKWSEESYAVKCMRLYLRQVMLQALLCARLNGAPSVAWRISVPNAMPLYKQSSYLELMRGLAQEMANATGVPLPAKAPSVLYASENQADGLYFRNRNEVNARSGYVNLDIGGSTTDVSLWLGNATRATAETSLLLGCRQMLFESISQRHLGEFEQDFAACEDEDVRAAVGELVTNFSRSGHSPKLQQKNMFLLDDLFGGYARELRDMMRRYRAQGRVSYLESLLLFNVGFVFHLIGDLLLRAWRDPANAGGFYQSMEICVAGNGGQVLKAFTDEAGRDQETVRNLCRMALARLPAEHPVKRLTLVQSKDPKREVALGLLSEAESMQSTIQGESAWGLEAPLQAKEEHAQHLELMGSFLTMFYSEFPMAGQLLLPGRLDVSLEGLVQLKPEAQSDLRTIVDNELFGAPGGDYAAYVRCFVAIKRLWNI